MEPFLLHQCEQGLSISAAVCNRRRRAHNLIGALIEGYSAQYGPSDVSVRDNTQQNSLFVDYEGNLELGHIDSSDNLADRCVRRCECQSPVSHFPARFSSMEQTRRERRTHGASESLRVSHDQG